MADNQTTIQAAGAQLAKAVEGFLQEVLADDGDPWSERPTQDIFKDWHPIQVAFVNWRNANAE